MKKLVLFLILLMVLPVWAQENPALLLFARGDLDGTIAIYVLNVDSGEERLITELLRAAIGPTGHDFGWSPDGRVWVMVVDEEGARSLSFYDATSGEETPFGEDLGLQTCASAIEWSPDGRYMSYSTATDNQIEGLRIYDTHDETGYTLPWGQSFPYWSPDGQYMLIIDRYFTPDMDERTRLMRTDDGRELLRRGNELNARRFAFSPDSRFFAYEEDETIWLYDLITNENINLDIPTNGLRWSPTGRYLLISILQEDIPYTAPRFIYDTRTGQLSSLNLNNQGNFAAWTENESTIVLRSDFQAFGDWPLPQSLIAYDLATAEVEALIEAETGILVGEISLNGNWLATLSFRASEANEGQWLSSIHIFNGESEAVLEADINLNLPIPALYTHFLSWSPDGRWLIVNSEEGIYYFDTETVNFEPLSPDGSLTDDSFWSPDSRYLAFQSGEAFILWNAQTDRLESLPEGISAIIGWQYGDKRASLICLYGYRDGDA